MEHGGLTHPTGDRMGQNLAVIGGTKFKDLPGDRATYMWYNECVHPGYNFGRQKNPGTGHFTQVVWRGTTHIGAARIRAGNKSFVVANYLPAGNMISRYEENVPAPISGKLEELMTQEMREAREFKLKYGDAGLSIRTTTSTSTRTVNGKTTVTKTVKTFHNDKLVKITVNGVEQPLEKDEGDDNVRGDKGSLMDDNENLPGQQTHNEQPIVGNTGIDMEQPEPVSKDETNDHGTGDKGSLLRDNEVDNKWRKEQYIEEKYPDQDSHNQPPMVVNPGSGQQLEPVAEPAMIENLLNKSPGVGGDQAACGCACNLL